MPLNRAMISNRIGWAMMIAAMPLAACSKGDAQSGGQGQRGPSQVGFVVVQPTSAPRPTELGGRAVAFESSEVRPQVNGLIRRLLFTEGGVVRQGQPLYQIDPSLYEASTAQASANLAASRAAADAARVKADRYRPLAQIEAISKQD
ncbi:MAG TPA: biotin/lipoyl-binding protein, partial [Sphingomicrobium sp.]|nr:biotin/lipoyl-binding protein [Sphingomicrobium sp.]